MKPKPTPLPDGLYWHRTDDGTWEPMLVRHGVQYALAVVELNGEPQLVPDFNITARGPLVMPT